MMVSGVELRQIMSRLGLSAQARAVVEDALARPSQKLRPGTRNLHGTFSSTKTVRAFRIGIPNIEIPAILALEYDLDVLAYLYRPRAIELSIPLADGIRHSALYSPLFLVVRKSGVAYEDWAAAEELGKGVGIVPGRIMLTVDARDASWQCLPTEGVWYIQHSTAGSNPCMQANADYLHDSLCHGKRWPAVDRALASTLAEAVKCAPGISVHDLRASAEKRRGPGLPRHDSVANVINLLILTQRLYVDLRAERLTEPAKARVYADEATAQAWAIIARSSQQGPVDAEPCGLTAEGRELLLQARSKDLAFANERYRALHPWLAGTSRPPHGECDLPRSTRYRLLEQYHEADSRYGAGYVGLIPAYANCGYRKPRYNERTTTLMEKYAPECYATSGCPTPVGRRVAYEKLIEACERESVPCPGFRYFCAAMKAQAERGIK